jgi:hypothetical protein
MNSKNLQSIHLLCIHLHFSEPCDRSRHYGVAFRKVENVFVTSPGSEMAVPVGLSTPGDRYWLVALLSTEAPFFLISYTVEQPGGDVVQTAVVAWESTLHAVIDRVGPARVVSLQRLAPPDHTGRDWETRVVTAVWSPSTSEALQTGPLLFAFRGETGLFDSFLARVGAVEGRHKLLDLDAIER